LSGDRVLVVSQRPMMIPYARPSVPGRESPSEPTRQTPKTRLTLVDISAAPKVVGTMTTEADYMDARQTGTTVRVVMRSSPRIDFPGRSRTGDDQTRNSRPGGGRPSEGRPDDKQATEANRAAVMRAPLDAWLPAFEVDGPNGGPANRYKPPCDQVSRPASYTGSSMLSVLTFDLGQGLGDPRAIAVAADGSTVYGNGKSLYVTGTPPGAFMPRRAAKPSEQRTDVYKFDVGGRGRPRYVASGSVKGDLLNQYSMSEHDGYLRLATTTSRFDDPGNRSSQSSVYVLGQNHDRLDQVGRVDGLGRGERIYSVRFIGAKAYVVTFRQVDPLYTLDLTDPRRPRTTGELKITGYSAYLHPTRDGKLLGVGRDADTSGRTRGLQISLFDVSGEKPRRVASHRLPDASSQAEFEPHAFLYWPPTGLTVIPVRSGGETSEALVLKVTGSSIGDAGTVRHPGKDYGNGVRRSLIVGDALWTISDDGARATDAATLKNQAWLPFG
ncbi:MAG: beta-propeller domain-containing protein, partial [Spirillospora sp.]